MLQPRVAILKSFLEIYLLLQLSLMEAICLKLAMYVFIKCIMDVQMF